MRTPTVSIIVPTLNEEDDIKDMLNSVKNQTYKNYEIIIVDGGSTDKTIEISKKYTKKIFILPKAGVTVSRNYGARKSKGSILQFMDADSVLMDKDYIVKLVQAFDKYNVDVVVNKTDAYPSKNLLARAQMTYRKKTWEARQKKVVFGAGPPDINFSCYTRKAFEKLGGYNEKMIGHDDVDLSRRSKKAGMKTVFVPNLVIYHKDPYTFGQVKRQAKWYARVLIRHQTIKEQLWTFFYLGMYPFLYFLMVASIIQNSWSIFVLINIIFFIPVTYLYLISKDFPGSLFLIYVLNPLRGVWLCSSYVKELAGKARPIVFWITIIRSGKHAIDKFHIIIYVIMLIVLYPVKYEKKLNFLKWDVMIENSYGTFFCRKKTGDMMTCSVFYEKTLRNYMRIDKGVFIDVGANVGTHTIPMAYRLKGRGVVVSIEPEPSNFQTLKKNIGLNGLENVYAINSACGLKNSKIKFYLSQNVGQHSAKTITDKFLIVDQKNIDSIVTEMKLKFVKLIKIDAEGAEPDVLMGAIKTIRTSKPDIIFEAREKAILARCLNIMKRFDYDVLRINDDYDDSNYLAIPKIIIK